MSEAVKRQFAIGRQGLLKDLEGTTKELFDVQLPGLNNTIRWQVGHILTSAEGFLFGAEGQLPTEYNEFFGYGSKPSAWGTDVPNIRKLVEQVESQLDRILQIPEERFGEQLPEAILGNSTYGELISFTAFHELTHVGQVHVMRKLVESSLAK